MSEYWAWQNDGNDHLESLVCPGLIKADELRDLIKQARKEGYEEYTKRAVDMSVFNIPYVCEFQNTPARLIGIVIPDIPTKAKMNKGQITKFAPCRIS